MVNKSGVGKELLASAVLWNLVLNVPIKLVLWVTALIKPIAVIQAEIRRSLVIFIFYPAEHKLLFLSSASVLEKSDEKALTCFCSNQNDNPPIPCGH